MIDVSGSELNNGVSIEWMWWNKVVAFIKENGHPPSSLVYEQLVMDHIFENLRPLVLTDDYETHWFYREDHLCNLFGASLPRIKTSIECDVDDEHSERVYIHLIRYAGLGDATEFDEALGKLIEWRNVFIGDVIT